ncbi:MAG: SDR family NAD(P)-dependent oxidoreductase, partial [Anaerolineae bacterium]|nr:SDR family NAD(P)-dependent oxidoreductase [Anaerolineae bacterium]
MNLEELTSIYDLTGRVIAISGGTGVLGGEMACALVGLGANVAILDRNPDLSETMRERLGCGAGCAISVYANVLERDSLLKAEEDIRAEFGPADTLINAAGGNNAGATTNQENTFFDMPEQALRSVHDLNTLGTVLPCQVFGRGMAERGTGVILNISSMAAVRPLTRVPAYSSAKAAITNFTQWLAVHMALEYSPNIRVNAVAPGFFIGNQNRFLLMDEKSGDLTPRGHQIIDHTPMRR